MPAPHPLEFRQRAVERQGCARSRCRRSLRTWASRTACGTGRSKADLDEGRRNDGLTTAEREEFVALRRELRVARLENEILKRAAAYFAKDIVLPK